MNGPAHSALVRGEDGNLHIRRFSSAKDAMVANRERDLPAPDQVAVVMGRQGGRIRHTVFARKLGLTPRQIRNAYKDGGLPGAIEQTERILEVPVHLVRLAEAYGLKQVVRMAKAGLI